MPVTRTASPRCGAELFGGVHQAGGGAGIARGDTGGHRRGEWRVEQSTADREHQRRPQDRRNVPAVRGQCALPAETGRGDERASRQAAHQPRRQPYPDSHRHDRVRNEPESGQQGAVPQDVLHAQRQKEPHGIQTRAGEQHGHVADGDRALPQQSQRQQRFHGGPGLDDYETGEQRHTPAHADERL